MGKHLNTVATKTATRWKERAKQDRGNRRNISRAQAFALELLEYMDSKKIKQIDLAHKMGVSAQQVNKILSAKANLTFETLDKIADALGVTITSPKIKASLGKSVSIPRYDLQIVHKRKSKVIEENVTSKTIHKRNPYLDTNMESLESYRYTATKI